MIYQIKTLSPVEHEYLESIKAVQKQIDFFNYI